MAEKWDVESVIPFTVLFRAFLEYEVYTRRPFHKGMSSVPYQFFYTNNKDLYCSLIIRRAFHPLTAPLLLPRHRCPLRCAFSKRHRVVLPHAALSYP